MKQTRAFREAFAKYRALDAEILPLAVENTNLKAQRLSFGAAHDAADKLQEALTKLVRKDAGSEAALSTRISALRAILAVREIEVLEAPHIAQPDDAGMTKLEEQMTQLESTARAALEELRHAASERGGLGSVASSALADFLTVHEQIIKLSRRNSNVRSLALSLGKKRTLSGVCDSALRELSARLDSRSFPATR